MRTRLIVWCDHFIGSRRIANMEDILQAPEASELHKHVQDLQTDLFRNRLSFETKNFDSAGFIEKIVSLRRAKIKKSKRQAQKDRYSLPPLYRT